MMEIQSGIANLYFQRRLRIDELRSAIIAGAHVPAERVWVYGENAEPVWDAAIAIDAKVGYDGPKNTQTLVVWYAPASTEFLTVPLAQRLADALDAEMIAELLDARVSFLIRPGREPIAVELDEEEIEADRLVLTAESQARVEAARAAERGEGAPHPE